MKPRRAIEQNLALTLQHRSQVSSLRQVMLAKLAYAFLAIHRQEMVTISATSAWLVQMLLVAFSRRMCCSRVDSVST